MASMAQQERRAMYPARCAGGSRPAARPAEEQSARVRGSRAAGSPSARSASGPSLAGIEKLWPPSGCRSAPSRPHPWWRRLAPSWTSLASAALARLSPAAVADSNP